MNSKYVDIEQLQKAFSEYLKNNRLRYTTERSVIFSKICQMGAPFTPDAIKQQLEDAHFFVSRASVYNTFELLIDAKIIVRQQFNGYIHYELKCIADCHLHLVCTHCGSVQKINDEKIDDSLSKYKIPKFTIEYYTLYFYGLCSKCKYRMTYRKTPLNRSVQKPVKKSNHKNDEKS